MLCLTHAQRSRPAEVYTERRLPSLGTRATVEPLMLLPQQPVLPGQAGLHILVAQPSLTHTAITAQP
jgi:hypothetical protein